MADETPQAFRQEAFRRGLIYDMEDYPAGSGECYFVLRLKQGDLRTKAVVTVVRQLIELARMSDECDEILQLVTIAEALEEEIREGCLLYTSRCV